MHRRSHHLDIDKFSSKNRGHKEASDFQTGKIFGACFMWRETLQDWRTVLLVKTWLCWQKVLLSKERVEAHTVGQRQRFHRKIACRCFFQTNCARCFFVSVSWPAFFFRFRNGPWLSIVDLETAKKAAVAYLKNTLLEILECPLVSRLENDQTAKVTPKGGGLVREIPRRFPGKSRWVKY